MAGLAVKYGWYPVRGSGNGRPAAPSNPSRERFNVFGVPGPGEFRCAFHDKADGDGFVDCLNKVYEKCGKAVLYPDNAGHHKTKKVNAYAKEGFGGDATPGFFPPYTPQPNPVGTMRREIKGRTANLPFKDATEMKSVVLEMPESGKIKTVETFDWLIARARNGGSRGMARGDGSRPRRGRSARVARAVCAGTVGARHVRPPDAAPWAVHRRVSVPLPPRAGGARPARRGANPVARKLSRFHGAILRASRAGIPNHTAANL